MRTRTKTTAVALTGAVALASGAYALGTQTGGGAAAAADKSDRNPPAVARFHRGLMGPDHLADRLGVDESELRDALDDFHRQLPEPGDLRDDFAESLAKELGIDQEKVEAALERVRENAEREFQQRHDELAQQLADRFNLDADEVEEALDGFPFFGHARPVRPPGP